MFSHPLPSCLPHALPGSTGSHTLERPPRKLLPIPLSRYPSSAASCDGQHAEALTCLFDGDGEAVVVGAALGLDRHVAVGITCRRGRAHQAVVGTEPFLATVLPLRYRRTWVPWDQLLRKGLHAPHTGVMGAPTSGTAHAGTHAGTLCIVTNCRCRDWPLTRCLAVQEATDDCAITE